MSDINMDLLDWRPQDSETSRMTIHDNIIQHHVVQEEASHVKPGLPIHSISGGIYSGLLKIVEQDAITTRARTVGDR